MNVPPPKVLVFSGSLVSSSSSQPKNKSYPISSSVSGSVTKNPSSGKPLSSALNQLSAGGISRTGASAAVIVIMMSVPILFFLVSQNSIMETMASSGLKD